MPTVIAGIQEKPYAIQTKLGRMLMVELTSTQKPSVESSFISISLIDLERYWSIKSYGTISINDPVMMSKD